MAKPGGQMITAEMSINEVVIKMCGGTQRMAKPGGQMITAEMSINEVVTKHPQAIKVLFRHGMQCTACYISGFHSIADGARRYGVELEPLLNDLNAVIVEKDPQGF